MKLETNEQENEGMAMATYIVCGIYGMYIIGQLIRWGIS